MPVPGGTTCPPRDRPLDAVRSATVRSVQEPRHQPDRLTIALVLFFLALIVLVVVMLLVTVVRP